MHIYIYICRVLSSQRKFTQMKISPLIKVRSYKEKDLQMYMSNILYLKIKWTYMHESVLLNFIGQMLQFVQVTCITISSSLEFRFDLMLFYLLSRTVLIIVCVFLLLLYMLMPSSLAKIFWSTPLPTCEERCGSELNPWLGKMAYTPSTLLAKKYFKWESHEK